MKLPSRRQSQQEASPVRHQHDEAKVQPSRRAVLQAKPADVMSFAYMPNESSGRKRASTSLGLRDGIDDVSHYFAWSRMADSETGAEPRIP